MQKEFCKLCLKIFRIILKEKNPSKQLNYHCRFTRYQHQIEFDDILNVNVAGFISKFHNNKLPPSFGDVFQSFNSQRVKNLKAKSPKLKSLNYFPTAAIPRIWNRFSLNVKNCKSYKLAKSKYKKGKIKSYSSFRCNKRKCYPCKT